MRQKNKPLDSKPNIVGILDSRAAAKKHLLLPKGIVDLVEWRADCFPPDQVPPATTVPLILTVRDPVEGGNQGMGLAERKNLFLKHLPRAAFLDVELRNIARMSEVLREASKSGKQVIASFHDFQSTPSRARMKTILQRAQDAGADIVKIATRTNAADDVASLLELLSLFPLPLSIMGMGPLGMASRLLFAASGSVLNYGWIHAPNVPGQWSAREMRTLLNRMKS